MPEVENTEAEMKALRLPQLANMAGAGYPDTADSPGGKFLIMCKEAAIEIYDDAAEEQETTTPMMDGDDRRITEEADGMVPYQTHKLWSTWTDLAGYNFDGELRGEFSGDDIEKVPQADLYEMAQNVIYQVIFGDY